MQIYNVQLYNEIQVLSHFLLHVWALIAPSQRRKFLYVQDYFYIL